VPWDLSQAETVTFLPTSLASLVMHLRHLGTRTGRSRPATASLMSRTPSITAVHQVKVSPSPPRLSGTSKSELTPRQTTDKVGEGVDGLDTMHSMNHRLTLRWKDNLFLVQPHIGPIPKDLVANRLDLVASCSRQRSR
jgi:hypothetical protein